MASIPASSDNVQTSDLCVSDVHKTAQEGQDDLKEASKTVQDGS